METNKSNIAEVVKPTEVAEDNSKRKKERMQIKRHKPSSNSLFDRLSKFETFSSSVRKE